MPPDVIQAIDRWGSQVFRTSTARRRSGRWSNDGVACAPVPSQHIEIEPAGEHVERDLLAIMEAQRAEFPQKVGGFCQLTSLTQHAVTCRILRRWTA
jgi:hypothetical protein